VYHIGLMALYDVTGSPDVLAYTEAFGKYNNWILDRGVMAANRHNRRGVLNAVGDHVQNSGWISAPGIYNVKIRFAKGADLGRWQFYTGGVNVGSPQDAYSDSFMFSEVNLGDVAYSTSGKKLFRFTVSGTNSVSIGHSTAIDYVMLTRQ
jgi:hypothetical protein